jgi:hypothetical protein
MNMKHTKLYSLLFLIFGLFLYPISELALAAEMIAQVVWVRGKVEASSPAGVRTLQRRSPIYEQDTIKTSETGSGQFVFTDGSIVALREGTVFKVDQYKFNPNEPKDNKYAASLAKGGFRTITGLISKANPDGYQVNTPVATIGVRGTAYTAVLKDGLQLSLEKGRIVVENSAGKIELDVARKQVNASITNLHTAPRVTDHPSDSLKGQPAITPASPPGGSSGGPTIGGANNGVTVGGSPNNTTTSTIPPGTSKTVTQFCIH